MFNTYHLIVSSLFVIFLFSAAMAQENRARIDDPREPVPVAPLVTAAATAERVRFVSPGIVVQLRLEVYNETGQKIFDTELHGGNVLDWHLQDGGGERLPSGSYACVLTIKSLSGRLSQRVGLVTVDDKKAAVEGAAQLSIAQQQTIGPLEGNVGFTIPQQSDAEALTAVTHDGTEGQLTSTKGALTFRTGNLFSGEDVERVRITPEGNVGIGTTKPKTKLDVAGVIRAREGFMFADGSTLKLNEKGVLTRANPDGVTPSVVTTQNKLAKFTDNAGTVGDSVVTESAGNIGINTATPTQALDVANGRIVTTGNQTLTNVLDSIIEVKTTVTNNAAFGTGFKARNFFNGSGNGPTGMDIAPTFAPTNSIGLARGFVSAAFFAPPTGVTISEAWGGDAVTIYSDTGGAVTNGNAFAINSPFAFGALKPTNQYGLHINNQGLSGTTNSYGLFVDAQSGSLNNYSAIFAGGNVGIGTATPAYKLHLVDPSNLGLRVQTNAPGGTVASFGGNGDFQIDASGVVGGRFAVKEGGNVGVGTASPSEKLSVAGTVQSTSGGFKFPDGSVQTTAAANTTYTMSRNLDLEINNALSVVHLDLPPGTYLLTATVWFYNKANFFGQINDRTFQCSFQEVPTAQIYLSSMAGNTHMTATYHSVRNITSGGVDLECISLSSFPPTNLFAVYRRFTAVKIGDNVVVQ